MTGIRRLPGYSERVSRWTQFRPGHVGGRVASAQPIRRRGGTLRDPARGGAAGAVLPPTPTDIYIYPIAIYEQYPESGSIYTIVGGGVSIKGTLKDTSDDTYISFTIPIYDEGARPLLEFEPYSPPSGKVIASAVLEFRARLFTEAINYFYTSTEIRICRGRHLFYDAGLETDATVYRYHYGDYSHGDPVGLTDTLSDEAFDAFPYPYAEPDGSAYMADWLAALAAGKLQVDFVPMAYDYDPGVETYEFTAMRIHITLDDA